MTRFVSSLKIHLDDVPAPQNLTDSIMQLSVEESLHLPTMFTIVVRNAYLPGNPEDSPWQFEPLFRFGQSIRISFGVSHAEEVDGEEQETTETLMVGEVTAIETHLTDRAQAPIVIRGYDYSHRLHRGRHCRSFQNMTDSDILRKIAQEVQIPCGQVDETLGPYGYGDIDEASGYVFQENQTNMEFLRSRAARHGFELFVENSNLHFRKPTAADQLKLTWLRDISSFRVRMTSAEQVSAVEVRGWDYSQKQVISALKTLNKATKSNPYTEQNSGNQKSAQRLTHNQYGEGSAKSSIFNGLPKDPKVIVVNQPVFSAEEADDMAQTLANELEGQFIQADARAPGNVKLRPGRVVNLDKLNKYSGSYYVTETRHLYEDRQYTTEFCVRGLRTGDLLSTLSAKSQLSPGNTHLVGIVTENKDPKGWGRVRVKFPTLSEDHNSYWARMVQVGAGANRGFDCLPEIDDEVLVAFEHGNIHRPYVLGGVWNGKDQPPESVSNSVVSNGSDAGTVRLRTLKSRTGHMFQLVEEDPNLESSQTIEAIAGSELFGSQSLAPLKGVHLKTEDGHQIDMCDPDKLALNGIRIQTTNHNQVSLSDADSNPGIALSTAAGQSISLLDQGLCSHSQVNLNTPGSVLINGGADAISSIDKTTTHQLQALGPNACNKAALRTHMSLLHNKITKSDRTVETASGHINQLALNTITLATGTKSVVQATPNQIEIFAPGVTIQAAPTSAGAAAIPGSLSLSGTQVHIRSATSVSITAPSISLNGIVNVTGVLMVNGRPVNLGRLIQ